MIEPVQDYHRRLLEEKKGVWSGVECFWDGIVFLSFLVQGLVQEA